MLLGLGIVAGLAITVAASSTAANLVYGLQPTDPLTLAAAVITLLAVGLASSYVPARRAARVDSVVALRAE